MNSKINFQKMARFARMEKSYLSKVINGSAELSQDQLFMICDFLEIEQEERDYMVLLLEFARTSINKRRDFLKNQIREIQSKKKETTAYLKTPSVQANPDVMDSYYLDPIHQIVHICLCIARYRANPHLIAHDIGLSPERLERTFRQLEKLGFIRREGQKIEVGIRDIHLQRKSRVYEAWLSQIRTLAMARSLRLPKDETYNLSVVFSANHQIRDQIRERFMEFLGATETLVKNAPDEDVFQINFDLLRWTSA